MEIFGIGPAELVLILLVAFVVLGPERLPRVAYTLGKWMRQLRSMSNELNDQVKAELAATTQELQVARQELQDLSGELSTPLRAPLEETAQELQTVQEEWRRTGQAPEDTKPTGQDETSHGKHAS